MNAKSDCEDLMNAGLPFAEKMLGEHGEFFPYGRAMRPNGEIVYVAGYDGREHPPSLDIIQLIKSAFVKGANDGSYLATALIYDVRIAITDPDEKKDAVAVSLNHRDGYSVIVMFPYRLDGVNVVFGEALAQAGEADIFPAHPIQ
jgi:hypothetical protein